MQNSFVERARYARGNAGWEFAKRSRRIQRPALSPFKPDQSLPDYYGNTSLLHYYPLLPSTLPYASIGVVQFFSFCIAIYHPSRRRILSSLNWFDSRCCASLHSLIVTLLLVPSANNQRPLSLQSRAQQPHQLGNQFFPPHILASSLSFALESK